MWCIYNSHSVHRLLCWVLQLVVVLIGKYRQTEHKLHRHLLRSWKQLAQLADMTPRFINYLKSYQIYIFKQKRGKTCTIYITWHTQNRAARNYSAQKRILKNAAIITILHFCLENYKINQLSCFTVLKKDRLQKYIWQLVMTH